MAELARGSVADRPWGRTLAALGMRGLSGQLTLACEGKEYCIAFANGAVVGAASPSASDAAVRIALTANLITSTQVGEIVRQLAAAPSRDDVEVVGELARLAPDQVLRLRRRVIAQRAARTFSIDRGDFVVVDRVAIPVRPGAELDVRAVVYLGARANLSEQRLADELTRLGGRFQLKPEAAADLPYFGFADAGKPILASLRGGSDIAALDAAHRDHDGRTIRAIVYALACCNACDVQAAAAPTQAVRSHSPSSAPTELKRGMERPRTPGSSPPPAAPSAPANAGTARTKPTTTPPAPSANYAPTLAGSIRAQRGSSSVATRPHREVDLEAVHETQTLIAEKLALVDAKTDHFALLGVARDAPSPAIRDAFNALARKLHPDRLASLAIADPNRDAQRLFAQLNAASAVLGDPVRRREYVAVLERGGEEVVRAEEAKANEIARRVLRAEEAYRRAEAALRRDQLDQALVDLKAAAELQPNEPEYLALLAWVKFAMAPDKKALATATRATLNRCAEQMTKSVTARFYLGRVERMLGHEREALEHFHEVLRRKPGHADAASEARVLEKRLSGKR